MRPFSEYPQAEGNISNVNWMGSTYILRRISIFSYLTLFLSGILPFFPVHLSFSAQSILELDLNKAIEIARKNRLLTSVGHLEIAEAKEEIEEIFGALRSPQFKVISYSGLISDARGDVATTADTNNSYNNLGPFIKADLTVVQPLYSFGKYASAMEAGQKNLEMKEATLKESKNVLSFEVTKAFLGVVVGHDGSTVGRELVEGYQELLEHIRLLQQDPESDIDASHLLEAQSMFFEIEKQGSEPDIIKEQALFYLRGLLNQDQNTTIVTSAITVPELTQTPDLLPQLLEFFRTQSPLMQSYNFGLQALSKKIDVEKKKKYPDLFLAIGAGYGSAPGRETQDNAYLEDTYNYKKLGAVLGLKWDFNFHANSAKEQKAFIEYQKILQKRNLIIIRTDGEIRKLYGESLRYQKILQAAVKSLKAAKTWLRLESDNLDLGIGDVKRLILANQHYYQLKGNEIETRYHYLVSLAQLAKTAGDMGFFLQWLENGKVQLR